MTYTPDDVWRLLGELISAQKETERLLKEQSLETEHRFRETEHRFRETERLLKAKSLETDKQIKQVTQQLGKLGNRLGEFVEWQVRPAAVRLFRERGIDVHELYRGVSRKQDGEALEIDLLVVNNTEAVVIEVKSKPSQTDVDKHLERLEKFKRLMHRYQDVQAMGAVAGMVVTDEVRDYAYDKGFFVLGSSGDDVVILNEPNFQPRKW